MPIVFPRVGAGLREHYRGKLEGIDELLAVETNADVRMWLKERREHLESSIERELREGEY